MTSLTDTQVVTASGGLVELGYDEAASSTTVTASAAASGHIIGDVTFISDGSPVYVQFDAGVVSPPTATASMVFMALEVDGSIVHQYWLTVRNSDGGNYLDQTMNCTQRLVLSAGSHNVKTRAWQSGGTNGVVHSGGSYAPALTRVSKIVQATQWPAVTTSTIICTSSTRPASPFEGQTIYETDTDRTYVWNGSAWVSPSVSFAPPAAKVLMTGNKSYTAGTSVSWDTDAGTYGYDTDGMWASGSPTRLTVNTAGIYSVTSSVEFSTTGGTIGIIFGPAIELNGSASAWVFSQQVNVNGGAGTYRATTTGVGKLSAGDYLTTSFNPSGGSGITIVNQPYTYFAATYLGKAS